MKTKAYMLAKSLVLLKERYKHLPANAVLVYDIKTGLLDEVSENTIKENHIVLKGCGVDNDLNEIYSQVEYLLFSDDKNLI